MATEIETFLSAVERFISDRGMSPTKFGKAFANDPLFVFQLRNGREPRAETRRKVIDAMAALSSISIEPSVTHSDEAAA